MRSWWSLAGTVLQDSRYALRWFRRELVLTGAIVLTLAFGIGLNTGVFSVLSGMVFRSRVGPGSAGFFQVLVSPPSEAEAAPHLFSATAADWRAWKSAPGIESMGAWTVSSGRLQDDADPSLLLLVSCDFFRVYRLDRPKLGRLFETAECESSAAAPAVLLGEELWRDRFHGDAAIVGHRISINRSEYRVAGILPAGFAGRLRGPGIWIPYAQQAAFYGGIDLFREDSRPWLTVEGRLLPGHSQAAATRELTALASQNARRSLVLTNGSIIQDPASRTVAGSVSVLLTGALGLILLLACTNVTMLLLSRAIARRYEMSVRLSLGASRARLLRMAATEGILLSLLAGGPSAILAAAVPAALRTLLPRMPHYPIETDWVVFLYMAGITLLAGCAAALIPAAESLRTNLSGSLKRQESVFSRRRWRTRELLVAGQVAMSLVLVVGASLFARTQHRLFGSDPGFDAGHVLLVQVAAVNQQKVQARLGAIPGVRFVSFATSVFWSRNSPVTGVSANFFQTLGIPIVRGHGLDAAAPRRLVVTEASAAHLWPGRDPLRQTFENAGTRWEVAGVVRESELDRRSPTPRVFRVIDPQAPAATTALLRFNGDSAAVSRDVTAALDAMGADVRELPRTLAADIGEMGSRFSVLSGFALFFGISAFVLAIVGVAGVMSFAVSRRTKEMGIRLALGATRADIVREVLRSGLKPVAWGFVAGLPLAVLFAAGLVYAFRNTPTPFDARDPVAFGLIPLILIAAAATAILKPALRACEANPASSLRQD
jgi:predicted permease